MGSSNPEIAVDDSATMSDDGDSTSKGDVGVDSVNDGVESPPPLDSSPFHIGEKVLAYHSQVLYEAKVLKVDFPLNEWRYYVHYLGWNKSWDEWVGMDRLKRYTKENVKEQQALFEKHGVRKITNPGHASQMKSKNPTASRGKKRKSVSKMAVPPEKHIDLQIPPFLKKQLIDDCEFVNHLGKLVQLPRSPTVNEILNKYREYLLKKDGMVADSVGEILHGLRCYFDKALHAILLYKNERQQYQEAISDCVSPSSVYGAEHLLRLFVKLPEIVHNVDIEEETLKELQQRLLDLLKFLQKNRSAFFLSTYQTPEACQTSTEKQVE